MSDHRAEFWTVIVCVAVFGVCLVAWLVASGDSDAPRRALLDAGYRDPQLGPSKLVFTGCAEDEVGWPARATNVRDEQVSVTVCCGGPLSFKGCTVRH